MTDASVSPPSAPDVVPPRPPRRVSAQQRKRMLYQTIGAVLLLGLGAIGGLALAPTSSADSLAHSDALASELVESRRQVAALQQLLKSKGSTQGVVLSGQLPAAVRQRHEREAKRYADVLKRMRAQGAAELVRWFVNRWNSTLDSPNENDRTGRRAELLSLLVGGMAANLHPGDYVPWQAEFFGGNWLGDLHYDLDGDGYPGKRSRPNPHDSFVNASICHIAMAMNQTARDARVLVMPQMSCDRADARMSIFLQGTTINDGLTELVTALRRAGFLVVERLDHGIRLILVGPGKKADASQE